MKNKKIIISALATVLSVGALSYGYSLMKKDLTLVVEGKETQVATFKSNVEELLVEQEVKYDKNDIVTLPLEKKLADGDVVEVIDVTEEVVKEGKEVPFSTNIVEDKTMLKGKSEVEVEGKVGKNELVYKNIYHNGKLVEKTFVEEVVASEPVDKIIKKGIKIEVAVATSRGESTRNPVSNSKPSSSNASSNTSSGKREMSVVATAYHGDGITATGTKPRWGTIAVDPKVIPYGTKVYIPQFDMVFVAEDTGGAIKGNKIDIYMNDATSVKNWGRRTIEIHVLG